MNSVITWLMLTVHYQMIFHSLLYTSDLVIKISAADNNVYFEHQHINVQNAPYCTILP